MGLFEKIWKPGDNAVTKRYEFKLFSDASIQHEIKAKGYSVQQLLTKEDVVQLNKDFFALLDMIGPLPDKHWTSGRVEDTRHRNFARQVIHNILPQRLEKFFNPAETDFMGGIFVAKKPSPVSRLYPHQDSSHTDETNYPAVYAWVALTDTTVRNGAMHIVPGSHLWGNKYRSLNVPWLYEGLEEELLKYVVPVPMKAGEVLFFDSAAIHYSTDNLSNDIRPAINFFIKPKQAMFLHHFMNETSPAGKVETYNVDIDFFYNCDFMQRPEAPYKFIGYEDYNLKKPTPQELHKTYKKHYK